MWRVARPSLISIAVVWVMSEPPAEHPTMPMFSGLKVFVTSFQTFSRSSLATGNTYVTGASARKM